VPGVAQALELDSEDAMAIGSVATRGRVARRSWKQSAIGSWVTTVDHKRIGIMYMYTAFVFFLMGGIEALLVRTQLAVPNNTVLSPEAYDEVFTHVTQKTLEAYDARPRRRRSK